MDGGRTGGLPIHSERQGPPRDAARKPTRCRRNAGGARPRARAVSPGKWGEGGGQARCQDPHSRGSGRAHARHLACSAHWDLLTQPATRPGEGAKNTRLPACFPGALRGPPTRLLPRGSVRPPTRLLPQGSARSTSRSSYQRTLPSRRGPTWTSDPRGRLTPG